jgi:hypothetical protein
MNCRTARVAIDSSQQRDRIEQDVSAHVTGCGECASYADGTFKLIALMQSQPRVEAPPDFDFRLRARIARERDVSHGVLDRLAAFWQKSFSPARAAAVLALIAVSITSGTIYFTRDATTPKRQEIASIVDKVPAAVSATPAVTVPVPEPVTAPVPSNSFARDGARGIGVSPVTSLSEPRVVALRDGGSEITSQEVLIYGPRGSRSIRVPRRGQSLGAELAVLQNASISQSSRSAAPVAIVETF